VLVPGTLPRQTSRVRRDQGFRFKEGCKSGSGVILQ
jgi:hypothetical protein